MAVRPWTGPSVSRITVQLQAAWMTGWVCLCHATADHAVIAITVAALYDRWTQLQAVIHEN